MNFGIDSLASWATLLFCMGVYITVFLIRRAAELLIKGLVNNFYWRELVLLLLPPLLGVLLGVGLSTGFSYPEGISGWKARALYGLVCGFSSGMVYKIALSIVRRLWPGLPLSTPADELPTPLPPG
jgi:hypothetical protein